MTPFNHGWKTFSRKYKLHKCNKKISRSTVISYIDLYNWYNINDYIPPLRKDFP